MKSLQNKIRNGIANSHRLRELAKDNKLTQETRNKLYNQVKENDKKIIFLKEINNALKKAEEKDKIEHSQKM